MERFPQSAQEAPEQISPETVESITQEELKLVEYLKEESIDPGSPLITKIALAIANNPVMSGVAGGAGLLVAGGGENNSILASAFVAAVGGILGLIKQVKGYSN